MAKAIQSADGYVLLPNPANDGKPVRSGQQREFFKPRKDEKRGGAVYIKSMIEGEMEECLFDSSSGLLLKLCRVSIPASWIKELEGEEEYERRIEGHAERVRAENEKARRDKNLSKLVPRMTNQERKSAGYTRWLRYVRPTEVVVPGVPAGSPGCPLGRQTLLYEDVVTVCCRRCRKLLLAPSMQFVHDYLRDPGTCNVTVLRRVIPDEVAVTLDVGESYCVGCLPGSCRSERVGRRRPAIVSSGGTR